MDKLSNYISEKLFTDVNTQINIIDDQIIKKQISKIFSISPINIEIKNKEIYIYKQLIYIDFSIHRSEKFIKDIYNQGYKFKIIDDLYIKITKEEQLKYIEDISVIRFTINFLLPIDIKNNININFLNSDMTFLSCLNVDNVSWFNNAKINLYNTKNLFINIHDKKTQDNNTIDNFLQNINPEFQIKILSIGLLYLDDNELNKYINDCIFINNKKLIPYRFFHFSILKPVEQIITCKPIIGSKISLKKLNLS